MGAWALGAGLRFGLLAIGLIFAALAGSSWRFGDPPTWTVFLSRTQAMVTESRVETYRISNGTMRSDPVVMVAWPDASAAPVALNGLRPRFYAHRETEAAEIAARYRPGEATELRVWDGAPYAARIDWFGLLHAGFLTLLAVPLTALGLFLAVALRTRRRRA